MASALAAVHAGVLAALHSLYDTDTGVQVIDGSRGPFTRADVVSLADIDADLDVGPLSPARATDEVFTVTVVISCFRAGADDAQAAATTRAAALWSLLFEYFRTSGQETLGVSTRTLGRLVHAEMRKSDDPEVVAKGRSTTVTATIHVTSRV